MGNTTALTSFNRFLLILIAITIILFWAGMVFLVWAFPEELGLIFSGMGRTLRVQPALLQIIISGFGGSAIAVSILILIGELFPKEEAVLKVSGQAAISIEVVVGTLKQALEQQPGVRAARPIIVQHNNDVDVLVDLNTDLDGELAPKADESVQIVRNLLERTWGLRVKDVKVTFAPSRLNLSGRQDPDGEIIGPGLIQRPTTEEPKPPGP